MVGEPYPQRLQRDAGHRVRGGERELLVGLLHGDLDRLPVLLRYGLRVVPRRAAGREHPDPEEVGSQGCHFDGSGPCPHPQAAVVVVEQLPGAERLVLAPCLRLLLVSLGHVPPCGRKLVSASLSQHFSILVESGILPDYLALPPPVLTAPAKRMTTA